MDSKEKPIMYSPMTSNTSDQELLTRCQHGDNAAFNPLIQRYIDSVFAYVSRIIPNEAQARELTRKIFVAAYQSLPRFHGETPLEIWLLTLAERQVQRESVMLVTWYANILYAWLLRRKHPSELSKQRAIDCQTIRDDLSAYIDGELSEPEARQVETHVRQCAACAQEFDELQDTVNLLQSSGRRTAPPELRAQILSDIEAYVPFWKKWFTVQIAPGMQATAVVAAMLLLFLGGVSYRQEIQRLNAQLQRQSSGERGAYPGSEASPGVKKIVILTGKLVSQGMALDVSGVVNEIQPDETKMIPGSINELVPAISQQLRVSYAEDIAAPAPTYKNAFVIQQISADVPANSGSLFSIFLEQLKSKSPQPTIPAAIETIHLDIFIIDQP